MKLKDFGVTKHEKVLGNGLRVVLFQRKGAPVSASLGFWGGARFDPANQPGLAHFTEHILLAGSKKWPTKDKMARYFEQFGGHVGGATSSEVLYIDASVAEAKDFNRLVEILDQVINHSLVNPHLIKTERGSILAEIGLASSRPNTRLNRELTGAFFVGSEVAHEVVGTEESVKAITRKDLLGFIEFLKTVPKVLVVAGDIEMAKVIRELGKLKLPKVSQERPAEVSDTEITNHQAYFEFPGDNVELAVGYKSTGYRNSEDRSVLQFIAMVLGQGRGSVLDQKLRYEKGLVYSSSARNMSLSSQGAWLAMSTCKRENFAQVVKIIEKELERVRKNGLTPAELKFVKTKSLNAIKFRLQSSEAWVDFHLEEFLIGRDRTVEDFLKDITNMTTAQVRRVAEKYFKEDNKVIVAVGNKLKTL